MSAAAQVATLSPAEIWRHAYRTGYDDAMAGRTHLLDEAGADDAKVIPWPRVADGNPATS